MDESLKNEIFSYLQATENSRPGEIPPIVQEYLNWVLLLNTSIAIAGWIAFIVVAALGVSIFFRKTPSPKNETVFAFSLVIYFLLGAGPTAVATYYTFKANLAPRLFLSEVAEGKSWSFR